MDDGEDMCTEDPRRFCLGPVHAYLASLRPHWESSTFTLLYLPDSGQLLMNMTFAVGSLNKKQNEIDNNITAK